MLLETWVWGYPHSLYFIHESCTCSVREWDFTTHKAEMGHWTARFTIFNPDYKNNMRSRLLTPELILFYGPHQLCGQKGKYFVIWRFRRPKFFKKSHLVRFSSRSFRGKRNRKLRAERAPKPVTSGFLGCYDWFKPGKAVQTGRGVRSKFVVTVHWSRV